MEEYRRCLERQEQERNERNHRADEINELQSQVDEQVLIAVTLQDEENQGRRRGSQVGRRRNVDRHRHSRVENLYTRDYLRRPTPRDLQRLLQKAKARGFP
ncbi:unnamed protein product [Prunus armeniaca]